MPTTTPWIGLTVSRRHGEHGAVSQYTMEAYIQAVTAAGGQPVLIPLGTNLTQLEELRGRMEGLILTGGSDADPRLFNGHPHPSIYGVEEDRDDLEIELAKFAVSNDWPLLAICRGIQMLNIALGGSLYTDIPSQLPGAVAHEGRKDQLIHPVSLAPGSQISHILGSTEVETNSMHHQGVLNLGNGLTASAWTKDGLVEAVEIPSNRFTVGVQWHPEHMQNYPSMQRLFEALIKAGA